MIAAGTHGVAPPRRLRLHPSVHRERHRRQDDASRSRGVHSFLPLSRTRRAPVDPETYDTPSLARAWYCHVAGYESATRMRAQSFNARKC